MTCRILCVANCCGSIVAVYVYAATMATRSHAHAVCVANYCVSIVCGSCHKYKYSTSTVAVEKRHLTVDKWVCTRCTINGVLKACAGGYWHVQLAITIRSTDRGLELHHTVNDVLTPCMYGH